MRLPRLLLLLTLTLSCAADCSSADDRLVFDAKNAEGKPPHVVLIAGDDEYRTEESMPMLAKILSQKHGFQCTVLFAFGPDSADYIDANNHQGLRGLDALDDADLMIIGTRYRQPDAAGAKHVTDFLNAGKPIIGIRTSTHAFNGDGSFGGIGYAEFGRKVLGEEWVSHHGRHKVEGARGVITEDFADHPILNGVTDVFAPSDVYGVIHLTDDDQILMKGAVTESLDPGSAIVDGPVNDPMQPFAWLHTYESPDRKKTGRSFCTTAGASVDLVNEDLRRMLVNAAFFLLNKDVPEHADVDFVDPFYPSFYGFITDKSYWKNANLKPADLGLGKSPRLPDPPGSPEWNFRPVPPQ
ncbi:MAG: ThuA domain-containing protein [Planctomycetaceae bacterium]